MPSAKVNNTEINYRFEDYGHENTLVFSNSLGTNFSMWKKQHEEISKHFNILFYDTRGHGKSEVTEGDYSAELLGNDILQLTEFLGIHYFYFCGISMGGLIGQWLALNGEGRIKKLIISNTAAKIGTGEGWNSRIKSVSENGLSSILEATAERWFTESFNKNHKNEVDGILKNFAETPLRGYISNCAMVRDADFRNDLFKISIPTLIISGKYDEVTTVEDGVFLQTNIKNAEHVILETCHLSNFEKPTELNSAVIQFLNQ